MTIVFAIISIVAIMSLIIAAASIAIFTTYE